ncbi:MAG: hypothetical protein ABFS56_35670 [Pseudomonadota bacterium]
MILFYEDSHQSIAIPFSMQFYIKRFRIAHQPTSQRLSPAIKKRNFVAALFISGEDDGDEWWDGEKCLKL